MARNQNTFPTLTYDSGPVVNGSNGRAVGWALELPVSGAVPVRPFSPAYFTTAADTISPYLPIEGISLVTASEPPVNGSYRLEMGAYIPSVPYRGYQGSDMTALSLGAIVATQVAPDLSGLVVVGDGQTPMFVSGALRRMTITTAQGDLSGPARELARSVLSSFDPTELISDRSATEPVDAILTSVRRELPHAIFPRRIDEPPVD